jgi:hypothetical protein
MGIEVKETESQRRSGRERKISLKQREMQIDQSDCEEDSEEDGRKAKKMKTTQTNRKSKSEKGFDSESIDSKESETTKEVTVGERSNTTTTYSSGAIQRRSGRKFLVFIAVRKLSLLS